MLRWGSLLLAFLLMTLPLAGCGGPATLAYTRGHYFEQIGNQHFQHEDPLSTKGVAMYRNAIEQYSAAINLQPRYSEAHHHRALCNWRIRNLNQSLSDFSEAIALSPNNARLWKERAWIYRELGYYDKAIEDYQRALQVDSKDVYALTGRAECECLLNRAKECFSDLDAALALDNKNSDVHCELASAYRRVGDYKRMYFHFDQATSIDGRAPEIYQRRAYAEFIVGNYEQANQDFHKAVAVSRWQYRSSSYSAILGSLSCKFLRHEKDSANWLDSATAHYSLPVASVAGKGDAQPAEQWPGPAIQYLNGDITQGKLIAAAGKDIDRLTEAYCYVALFDQAEGNRQEASDRFDWVIQHGTRSFVEYEIAKAQNRPARASGTVGE